MPLLVESPAPQTSVRKKLHTVAGAGPNRVATVRSSCERELLLISVDLQALIFSNHSKRGIRFLPKFVLSIFVATCSASSSFCVLFPSFFFLLFSLFYFFLFRVYLTRRFNTALFFSSAWFSHCSLKETCYERRIDFYKVLNAGRSIVKIKIF